jgi:oxalate decarboxylase
VWQAGDDAEISPAFTMARKSTKSEMTSSGEVRIADSTNFPASETIASTQVAIKPGGMREMHWHPNAEEWLYILTGTASC